MTYIERVRHQPLAESFCLRFTATDPGNPALVKKLVFKSVEYNEVFQLLSVSWQKPKFPPLALQLPTGGWKITAHN
ncbi:unnamed protein product [Victoria cruziana]